MLRVADASPGPCSADLARTASGAAAARAAQSAPELADQLAAQSAPQTGRLMIAPAQALSHQCRGRLVPAAVVPLSAFQRCARAQQHSSTSASAMESLCGPTFFLDDFAIRQWDDPNYSGTRISFDKAEFVKRIHQAHAAGAALVDGYAPFCKHVFVPNFIGALVGALPITDANRHLLKSGYTKRRPEELAVLTRWFRESDVQPVPAALHLDVILYSREQLAAEYAALPPSSGDAAPALPPAPWGIISVKAQDVDHETPMQPITMLRNALGKDEGGSGVALDRQAYEASVAYWENHAPIVAGERPNGE